MLNRLQLIGIGSAVFWMLLLPFDYQLFDWFFKAVQFPVFSALHFLDENLIFETDTFGTYLLLIFVVFLGAVFMPITQWILKKYQLKSVEVLKIVLGAILFFFLISYGWNKAVKQQFYLPEPNILYTPFGQLSKDIAYWSVVGSSYSYTVILGYVELLVAFLLLFKRTQFLASILCIGVFAQVVLVNFSFDISVKLLSFSLLAFSIFYSCCFATQWRNVFGFPTLVILKTDTKLKRMVKVVFVLVVVAEVFTPNILGNTYNDDHTERLAHHGAYQVVGSNQIRRAFIHRQHYLILELKNGKFQDFAIDVSDKREYVTRNREFSCSWNSDLPKLIHLQDTFELKELPYQSLPLLKSDFHWTSDEFH